jgi:hypothetical protein
MRAKLLIATLLLTAIPVLAHHAFSAEFDENKPVKLQGRVVKMDWINPHAWIHLDVKNPDGTISSWMIETGPPNALLKRGWNKNSLPEGTEIIVDGYQSKDGELRANGRDVTFPDGKKLFAGTSGNGAPGDKPEK